MVTEQAFELLKTCPDMESQIGKLLLLVKEQKENGPINLLVRQIIDSARAKGELREDIPLSYITNALLARMISYLMYQCHHIGDDMPPEEMRRLVTESIMNELCKKNI